MISPSISKGFTLKEEEHVPYFPRGYFRFVTYGDKPDPLSQELLHLLLILDNPCSEEEFNGRKWDDIDDPRRSYPYLLNTYGNFTLHFLLHKGFPKAHMKDFCHFYNLFFLCSQGLGQSLGLEPAGSPFQIWVEKKIKVYLTKVGIVDRALLCYMPLSFPFDYFSRLSKFY